MTGQLTVNTHLILQFNECQSFIFTINTGDNSIIDHHISCFFLIHYCIPRFACRINPARNITRVPVPGLCCFVVFLHLHLFGNITAPGEVVFTQ